MSFADERAADQQIRAEVIAAQLTGMHHPARGIVRAMLALVVADERTDLPREKSPGPDPGARQVLKTAPKVTQDALW